MKKVLSLMLIAVLLLLCTGCSEPDHAPAQTEDDRAEQEALRREELIAFFNALPMEYTIVEETDSGVTVSMTGPDFGQLVLLMADEGSQYQHVTAKNWEKIIAKHPDVTKEYSLTVTACDEASIRQAFLEHISNDMFAAALSREEFEFLPPDAMTKGDHE